MVGDEIFLNELARFFWRMMRGNPKLADSLRSFNGLGLSDKDRWKLGKTACAGFLARLKNVQDDFYTRIGEDIETMGPVLKKEDFEGNQD